MFKVGRAAAGRVPTRRRTGVRRSNVRDREGTRVPRALPTLRNQIHPVEPVQAECIDGVAGHLLAQGDGGQ